MDVKTETINPSTSRSDLRHDQSAEDDRKVYVGGFPPKVTESKIRTALREFGPIQTVFIKRDSAGRRSKKRYGFVTFENVNGAQRALSAGSALLKGTRLNISIPGPKAEGGPKAEKVPSWVQEFGKSRNPPKPVAKPRRSIVDNNLKMDVKKETINPSTSRSDLRHDQSAEDDRKVYVGGFPPKVTESKIRTALREFGPIQTVFIKRDSAGRRSKKRYGFVTFENVNGAQRALSAGSALLKGTRLSIAIAGPKAEGGPKAEMVPSRVQEFGKSRNPPKPVAKPRRSIVDNNPSIERIIATNRRFLLRKITLDEEMFNEMIVMGLMTVNQRDEIQKNATNLKMVGSLLDFITKRGPTDYKLFVRALENTRQTHVVEKLSAIH